MAGAACECTTTAALFYLFNIYSGGGPSNPERPPQREPLGPKERRPYKIVEGKVDSVLLRVLFLDYLRLAGGPLKSAGLFLPLPLPGVFLPSSFALFCLCIKSDALLTAQPKKFSKRVWVDRPFAFRRRCR